MTVDEAILECRKRIHRLEIEAHAALTRGDFDEANLCYTDAMVEVAKIKRMTAKEKEPK